MEIRVTFLFNSVCSESTVTYVPSVAKISS